MLKVIRATKRQCGDPGNLREGCDKATNAATQSQLDTQPGGHDSGIMKRVTDGQVAVKGHSCQETNLTDASGVEEIHLQETAIQGNALLLTQQAGEHLRYGRCGVPDLQERKGADEEVHGSVEVSVQLDHCDDDQVSKDNESVNEEQWNKTDDRTFPGIREGREDEFLIGALIGALHFLVENKDFQLPVHSTL